MNHLSCGKNDGIVTFTDKERCLIYHTVFAIKTNLGPPIEYKECSGKPKTA